MKKIAIIAIVAMLTGAVSADLAIDWRSQAGGVELTSGGGDFLVGSRIDLIYSVSGAITIAGLYPVTLGTETILDSGVTGANSLWSGLGNTFIGDYTAGKFFTRVYENNGSGGEFFLDIAMDDGVNFVYNPLDLSTVFNDNTVAGVQFIGANDTTVVPEPATIGLMGIAGLGMFLARKKARR